MCQNSAHWHRFLNSPIPFSASLVIISLLGRGTNCSDVPPTSRRTFSSKLSFEARPMVKVDSVVSVVPVSIFDNKGLSLAKASMLQKIFAAFKLAVGEV